MKKFSTYILLISLLTIYQSKSVAQEKIYVYEHLSSKGENLSDYIQLFFDNDTIVSGVYYYNSANMSFVADIKFKSKDNINLFLSFVLINYKYTLEKVSPFKNIDYIEVENIPFEIGEDNFQGNIKEGGLDLIRTKLWYQAHADRMFFKLLKTD